MPPFWNADAIEERAESAVSAYRIEPGIDVQVHEKIGSCLIRLVEPLERAVCIAEADVNERNFDLRNEPARGCLLQLPNDFHRRRPIT
jgi:hypothetical protein